MCAATFQVLAALVTAGVGALATLAALSPATARVKRLERLLALRESAEGLAAQRNLDLAIRRASEEVAVDGEVGRRSRGYRALIVPLTVTAAVMTVVSMGLLAEPEELQRRLVLASAVSLYVVAVSAMAVHLLSVRIRHEKRVQLFGDSKSPNLLEDQGSEPPSAERAPEGDVPPA